MTPSDRTTHQLIDGTAPLDPKVVGDIVPAFLFGRHVDAAQLDDARATVPDIADEKLHAPLATIRRDDDLVVWPQLRRDMPPEVGLQDILGLYDFFDGREVNRARMLREGEAALKKGGRIGHSVSISEIEATTSRMMCGVIVCRVHFFGEAKPFAKLE